MPRTWNLRSEAAGILLEEPPKDVDLAALRASLHRVGGDFR